MIEIDFSFHTSQRDRFRSKELINHWGQRYPEIFDEQDIQITNNQPHYHFFEWLGAVLLYESLGYLSLIEKYETKSHSRKFDIFTKTAPQEVVEYVLENRSGVPDLFVYSPDRSDWFFCEVKGLADRLQQNQLDSIAKLEALSVKDVRVLKFSEF
jgi:hypothetical protein